MARTDWVALITEPAAEYTAKIELERLGLAPYLPQFRRRWLPPHTFTYQFRRYPLFPRYLLLPINQADPHIIPIARGLRRHRPLLATDEGVPWRAPQNAIQSLQQAEASGIFDEKLTRNTPVRLTTTDLDLNLTTVTLEHDNVVQLFTPLLGGARLRVRPANVARS